MPINLDELLIEVPGDTMPSLIMGGGATGGSARIGICLCCRGVSFCMALGAINISFFSCDALGINLPITSSTVGADHEDFHGKASRRGWRAGDEVGDGFGGAFRLCPQICLQDQEQGIVIELTNLHHVDSQCKLVGTW